MSTTRRSSPRFRIPGLPRRSSRRPAARHAGSAPPFTGVLQDHDGPQLDLTRRREQLKARVAELQFDLGGLVYEMAIRNQMRVDLLVDRAAVLQSVDAELSEVERILRLEQQGTAGSCVNCGAPHSSGAAFCWQCGQTLMAEVPRDAIVAPPPPGI